MNARDEMDLLLRVTSQIAQKMLESGGLMNFGTVLGAKRDVQVLMPKSMKKDVAWDELVSYWKREIGTASAKAEWRAVACCTFATKLLDDNSLSGPLLVVHIEHFEKTIGAEDVAYKCQGSRGTKITLCEATQASAKRWLTESAPSFPIEQGV